MQGELTVEGFPAPPSDIGIYIIYSESWKFYVGQSTQLKRRKYEHLRLLRKGEHVNTHLQRAFNKYQELKYMVVEYLSDTSLLTEREQYWMDRLHAYEDGMNQRPAADSSLGVTRTPEQCARMSEIFTEYWGKEENRQAQSERRKKFFEANPGHLSLMSKITKDKFKEQPELAEKHSEYMKQVSSTPEFKANFVEYMAAWRSTTTQEERTAIAHKAIATKGPEAIKVHLQKAKLTRMKSRKPRSHNKSTGVLGVQWVVSKSRCGTPRLDASARWTEPDGTKKSKSFSVARHGLLPAFRLALLHREEVSQRLEAIYAEELENM